jgi:hypothetical protein
MIARWCSVKPSIINSALQAHRASLERLCNNGSAPVPLSRLDRASLHAADPVGEMIARSGPSPTNFALRFRRAAGELGHGPAPSNAGESGPVDSELSGPRTPARVALRH